MIRDHVQRLGWAFALMLGTGAVALAKRPSSPVASGPAASASEIPELASLLRKAEWQPTPELSGVFQAGTIFEVTSMGHRMLSDRCVQAEIRESTYTSAELVTSLQAGVTVRGLAARGAITGEMVKKVKFGTPTQLTIPRLDLIISEDCQDKLVRLPASTLQTAYVVQEVLSAQIAEQTCGRVDASGRIVGLGEAEAEFAQACAQASLDPVAVGYRVVPLGQLMELPAAAAPPAAPPTAVAPTPPPAAAVVSSPSTSQAPVTKPDKLSKPAKESKRPKEPTPPEVPGTLVYDTWYTCESRQLVYGAWVKGPEYYYRFTSAQLLGLTGERMLEKWESKPEKYEKGWVNYQVDSGRLVWKNSKGKQAPEGLKFYIYPDHLEVFFKLGPIGGIYLTCPHPAPG